jgi:HEAT repeat protein
MMVRRIEGDCSHSARCQAIGPGARDALPVLLDALKDPDSGLRLEAALALLKVGDPKAALTGLTEALKSSGGESRRRILTGLALLGAQARRHARPRLRCSISTRKT